MTWYCNITRQLEVESYLLVIATGSISTWKEQLEDGSMEILLLG